MTKTAIYTFYESISGRTDLVNITVTDNGLTVITDRIEGLRSAALGLWVNVGSRHEAANEHGIAHLLEHMAFKGTQSRSARQIAEEIENVGAAINAYTGRDQTGYYVRCLSGDIETSVDILSDIMLRPVFDAEELEREKNVIIQEIGEAEDTPDDILFDYLQDLCFPEQILGRPILGTRESVLNLTERDLRGYMTRYYHPKNMVFAASGDIKEADILRLAEKYFTFPAQNAPATADKSVWGGGVNYIKRDLEQSHVAFALPGVGYHDPDYYVSEIYSSLLGGGMSSRLFQEVREKRGLAYTVGSFSANYHDGGVFGVYAGSAPEKTEEVVNTAVEVMEKTAEDITESETERAKAQLRAGVIMALEKPYNRCEAAVRQFFVYGKTMTPEELIEQINAVSVERAKAFAARMLRAGRAAFCTVGSLEAAPLAETSLSRFAPH